MNTTTQTTPVLADDDENSVTLDRPIQRANGPINLITLRRPNSGELRGLNLLALIQMDVDAVTTLVPRISQPMITKPEVQDLDPADFTALAMVVNGFLQQKGQKPASPSA